MDAIKRHHGLYRGTVQANLDPSKLRRIKASVPQVTGTEITDWIWPVISTAQPPSIGSGVWVTYVAGDPDFPVWVGGFGTSTSGLFSYGEFFDTSTQAASAINTAYAVQVPYTYLNSGVSTSPLMVANPGVYSIKYSLNFSSLGTGIGTAVFVWLRKSGIDLPHTTTRVEVPGITTSIIANWSSLVSLLPQDSLQVMWSTNNTSNRISPKSSASPVPDIPSAHVSIAQVS